MSQIATTNKTVLFGRLDKYAVRRAGAMTVLKLTERAIDFGQVWFVGWIRRDGALLDAGSHPVKALQQA